MVGMIRSGAHKGTGTGMGVYSMSIPWKQSDIACTCHAKGTQLGRQDFLSQLQFDIRVGIMRYAMQMKKSLKECKAKWPTTDIILHMRQTSYKNIRQGYFDNQNCFCVVVNSECCYSEETDNRKIEVIMLAIQICFVQCEINVQKWGRNNITRGVFHIEFMWIDNHYLMVWYVHCCCCC